jgi:fatty-acyl-CoA synthase
MINLSSFVRYHAQRTPLAPAISYMGNTVDYGTLYDRVSRIGGWLTRQNVGADDVVAVLMKNSAAFLEIALAVSHVGGIFLPINFRLSAQEVQYIVADSAAKLLLVDEELVDKSPAGIPTMMLDSAAQANTSVLTGMCEPAAMQPRATSDTFRLMYTSGTTDRPKGVMHSYENFYFKCADHSVVLGLSAATRLLVVGPLYHVGAFDLPGVAVLWRGGMLAVLRDFDPGDTLALIAHERLNAAWLAPVITSALLNYPARNDHDVSSLEWVVGGGERTPESQIRKFTEYFTRARYIDAYGLTESCSGDSFMEAGRELEKIGSTGRATPHVEISIRDEDGMALAPQHEGEICLRGPKVFKCYWRDPEKTAAAFVDGWFRTGDIGYLDADGFLFVTDRKKDMIISGGENIASSEVERVIQLLPGVSEVAVIGMPDPRWGEAPAAIVVLRPGAALTLAELDAHCRQHLAPFKSPRQMILRQSLPRNPSGKILKRELRDELAKIA